MAELKPGQPVTCNGLSGFVDEVFESYIVFLYRFGEDWYTAPAPIEEVFPRTRADVEADGLWCGFEDPKRIKALAERVE